MPATSPSLTGRRPAPALPPAANAVPPFVVRAAKRGKRLCPAFYPAGAANLESLPENFVCPADFPAYLQSLPELLE